MEKLSSKRARFTKALVRLIDYANEQPGCECALDQVRRTQAEANANAASGAGISNSLHLIGLAADIVLYKNGKYMMDSEDYRFMGDKWKSLGADHAWGGDFKKKDGNHFSIIHNGVR